MILDAHSKMTLVSRPTCGMFETFLEGSRLCYWNPSYSPSPTINFRPITLKGQHARQLVLSNLQQLS